MFKKIKFLGLNFIIVFIVLLAIAKVTDSKVISHNNFITYIVQPGQTLWDIALDLQPDKDPRRLIFQIRKINDITPKIQPGQRIIVPKFN